MKDPFSLQPEPEPVETLEPKNIYYNEVDNYGHVCKYKIESGAPVMVADLGNVKDFFNRAIQRAALMTQADVERLDIGRMTHIELAAIKVAVAAAGGDLQATQEICDRIMGKAKLVSESRNLNLTIDDILNGVQPQGVLDA